MINYFDKKRKELNKIEELYNKLIKTAINHPKYENPVILLSRKDTENLYPGKHLSRHNYEREYLLNEDFNNFIWIIDESCPADGIYSSYGDYHKLSISWHNNPIFKNRSINLGDEITTEKDIRVVIEIFPVSECYNPKIGDFGVLLQEKQQWIKEGKKLLTDNRN